ncbi:Protein TOC75, chloroplastic [Hordeum vulgare]|nr:Protein TOC75, chloroplastic [Hordeum vulgare]
MSLPLGAGSRPRTDHEEGTREPIRFYMQIQDEEDITMLAIPSAFRTVLRQWLVLALPASSIFLPTKWCKFRVEVEMFKGHVVLGHDSEYFCWRHKIVPDDLVVPRLSGLELEVQTFNDSTSNIYRVRCSKYGYADDISHAL